MLTSNLREPGIKEFGDFSELPLDLTLEEPVLKDIVTNLLKDHHSHDIHLQLCEVLMVENIDKVRDVQVDELEHICLVDHGILQTSHELVILFRDESVRQISVNYAENTNEYNIDRAWYIF